MTNIQTVTITGTGKNISITVSNRNIIIKYCRWQSNNTNKYLSEVTNKINTERKQENYKLWNS